MPKGEDRIRCEVCPGRSVCLRWRGAFSVDLEYADLVGATECLKDILGRSPGTFSIGDSSFAACRPVDGYCYLMCRDQVILRFTREEGQMLLSELTLARAALEESSGNPLRVV